MFSAICIKESWLYNTCLIQLKWYKCVPQGTFCSSKVWLIIYHCEKYYNKLKLKLNKYTTWQG